ncbi:unnamed protein product [Orchesella dallaii]|uniref:DNA topoisomerase 1 n=1 Tax=Orchesella dallaii TaxID=48710 RepID=A0ABP1RWD5_9HEXA
MTNKEKSEITNFGHCDFSQLVTKLNEIAEAKTHLSPKERNALKKKRQADIDKYKTVHVDRTPELVSNCTVEPPGLFMGRGNDNAHIGRVKRRIQPEDITINIDDAHRAMARPPAGHRWGAIVQNKSVMWLASWKDPISGRPKYMQLHHSSKIKNDREEEKFQVARKLKAEIRQVRAKYEKELKSRDDEARQRGTAVYLIDNFALRAGNEKQEGATDTVGCCSLRVEHISFLPRRKDQKKELEGIHLNFLGKDSIRYEKDILVSRLVRDNLQDFAKAKGKKKGDLLFDLIDTRRVNEYLASLMKDLTAKVFRTFRATQHFQEKLAEYSRLHLRNRPAEDMKMKVIVHKKANLAVAQLLNHQTLSKPGGKGKAVKNHEKKLKAAEVTLKSLPKSSDQYRKVEAKCDILKEELDLKRELQTFALGTSKTNYIDPAATADWCTKYSVPVNKVYSKTQREKFKWAFLRLSLIEE